MTVDVRLEHLYQRIELVKGIGDPRRGKLCIMSFVALLAGENHSDSPAIASRVIRRFAIPINDRMPATLRQRLKPFAPRIIGTQDHLDSLRAETLACALRDEIAPRIQADFQPRIAPVWWPSCVEEVRTAARTLETRLAALADNPAALTAPEVQMEIAGIAADLLVRCANAASYPDTIRWYWNMAIDLLDRLCDIRGESAAAQSIDVDRVAWLEAVLARRERVQRHAAMATRALERLRRLLPQRADAG